VKRMCVTCFEITEVHVVTDGYGRVRCMVLKKFISCSSTNLVFNSD